MATLFAPWNPGLAMECAIQPALNSSGGLEFNAALKFMKKVVQEVAE
ncbi:hypothetical protein [Stutzerimonas kunmingensis]|nr:hypothetical protein [Stutzerimonas kunmingensis]